MGQEIASSHFQKRDFTLFQERLTEETNLLGQWFDEGCWEDRGAIAGFELESWLVDRSCRPQPINEQFLAALDSDLVVPELARFNVELNNTPRQLTGSALREMERELRGTWERCNRVAADLKAELVMIGILPTVEQADLCLANMSVMRRYRALNEQVLRLRQGRALQLDIQGREHLRVAHQDVMLESAATSFQIHLQVPGEQAARCYNAAQILSAPMVAACANSPFLFGKDLWDETRVPLFEQAVEVGEPGGKECKSLRRVTFGTGYARDSLFECFAENLARYPTLLPMALDTPPAAMGHVRLHNGTIWRWNRPLIGVGADGSPHLRVEHRVVPAGPTVVDAIANAALFFGLLHDLLRESAPAESRLPFQAARDNFYHAARNGLEARVTWLDGQEGNIRALLLGELLPRARRGLEGLALDAESVDHYLGIVEARLSSNRTGAAWQRAYVARHGRDMGAMACAYAAQSRSGAPVHEWVVSP